MDPCRTRCRNADEKSIRIPERLLRRHAHSASRRPDGASPFKIDIFGRRGAPHAQFFIQECTESGASRSRHNLAVRQVATIFLQPAAGRKAKNLSVAKSERPRDARVFAAGRTLRRLARRGDPALRYDRKPTSMPAPEEQPGNQQYRDFVSLSQECS